MPAAIPFTYMNPKLNWGEWAGPEPALDNLKIEEKRGRVLGGTSSINAMIFSPAKHKLFDAFLRGGEQAGYQRPNDHNGAEQEGVHIAQAYIDDGRRCSASHAYRGGPRFLTS